MPNDNSKNEQSRRFAYDGLDRVIHERARLSVLTSLIAHPKGLVFGNLKAMCGLTDGNLSRHLQVLERAGRIVGLDARYALQSGQLGLVDVGGNHPRAGTRQRFRAGPADALRRGRDQRCFVLQ